VFFIIYLAKEALVAAYRYHARIVERILDSSVPGAVVCGVVYKDYLKVCQNLLIENAVEALLEILPVVIVNQDTEHRIIGIVQYGYRFHRG
jgi:PII-like signaling protein